MKIRFPKENAEVGIPDYAEIIKTQASKTGKKSANEYILDLIQEDIRNNPEGLHQTDFEIIRDMREINKKQFAEKLKVSRPTLDKLLKDKGLQ